MANENDKQPDAQTGEDERCTHVYPSGRVCNCKRSDLLHAVAGTAARATLTAAQQHILDVEIGGVHEFTTAILVTQERLTEALGRVPSGLVFDLNDSLLRRDDREFAKGQALSMAVFDELRKEQK